MIKLTAFKTDSISTHPWRVLVDGKPDPRNRDFESPSDIRRCYDDLVLAGLVEDYKLIVKD